MTQAISADAILSANARAGYAIGNVLPYATIGLSKAWYDYNYSYDDDIAPSFTFKDSRTGWNVGAGIDAALTDNIFARAEYRYYDFRTEKFTGGWTEKYQQHTATLGIGYKF